MNNSYKFFNNKECAYFPCHKIKNTDEFNCMFCYCPLYPLGLECGGNPKIYEGIKDCSDCLKIHMPDSHDFVMSNIGDILDMTNEKINK